MLYTGYCMLEVFLFIVQKCQQSITNPIADTESLKRGIGVIRQALDLGLASICQGYRRHGGHRYAYEEVFTAPSGRHGPDLMG